MGKLILEKNTSSSTTIISNYFLDKFMPRANGEYVKVYMYLLRCAASADADLSVSTMADTFDHTEKDILRALRYWEQLGLISLSFDDNKQLSGIRLEDINALANRPAVSFDTNFETPKVPSFTVISKEATTNDFTKSESIEPVAKVDFTEEELNKLISNEEVSDLLYIAQTYLGKTFSSTETNSILYIYDSLGFSVELIEFLIEFCLSNNHKSIRYIEKVAIDWSKHGITSVEAAKNYTALYSKNCYPVFKAFGLTNRNPAEVEKSFIIKWTNEFGFPMDIIVDACNRTIQAIHQPSFEYADSILSKWKKKGITTLNDIKVLDDEHQKAKSEKASKVVKSEKPTNNFNNFKQRDYDYDDLERKLLKTN